MTHAVRDPSAGDPMTPEQRLPQPVTALPERPSPSVKATNGYDCASFAAGQDCGTRVAACLARLSALELVDGARWWNRRGRRLIASALVAYAEELESGADADGRCGCFRPPWTGPTASLRFV
jgi:hypothetical protein